MARLDSICTDQGTNFEAELFKYMCELLRVKKLRSTGYHPQTNGEVERANKTLKQMIKCFVNDHHNDWDLFLQQLCCAFNTSINETTKRTPFEILYGKEFVFPLDCQSNMIPNKEIDKKLIDQYIETIKQNKEKLSQIVNEQTNKSVSAQKRYYDKTIREKNKFKVGDLVLLENFQKRVEHTSKFEPEKIGPFEIIEIFNDNLNYKLKSLTNNNEFVTHYNRMHPYFGNKEGTTLPVKRGRGRPPKPKNNKNNNNKPKKYVPTGRPVGRPRKITS